MEDFFSLIYRLNVYGEQLYYHFRGWSDSEQGFIASLDKFPLLFCVTIGTAVLCFLVYYYILNHPRLNRWYFWLIPLFVSIAVGFIFGYVNVFEDMKSGIIAESLRPYIGTSNAVMFGIYNGFVGGMTFFVFTLLFRRWSKNCKHSPWKLLSTMSNNKGKQDHE